MAPRNCSECGSLMEHQEGEADTGIIACWVCTNGECENVEEDEPLDGDDL